MSDTAHHFDDLDRQMIALLRSDGRAPVSKMAQVLGVSRATVQFRLDRLINSGAILGFTVRVRQDHPDDMIQAVMMIEVVGKSTDHVVKKLRGLPELHRLHTTNGNWDLVAEIRTDSLVSFDAILRHVRMIDGISNSETSLLLTSI